MTPTCVLRACCLALVLAAAAPAAAAAPQPLSATAAQESEVRDAVARLKAAGLPPPLPQAVPDAEIAARDTVLVSDAVSVVETALVDFARRRFYLRVVNPWTNADSWYGDFALDAT